MESSDTTMDRNLEQMAVEEMRAGVAVDGVPVDGMLLATQSSDNKSEQRSEVELLLREISLTYWRLSWLNTTSLSPHRLSALPAHFRIVRKLSLLAKSSGTTTTFSL